MYELKRIKDKTIWNITNNPLSENEYIIISDNTTDSKIKYKYNDFNDICYGDYCDRYNQVKKSAISEVIAEEELQMIRDEVKKYMTDQMKKDAQKIAGKLFDDIEKLKKEKTAIKRDLTEFKKQLQQTKEDIRAEIIKMEEMMEKKATELLRFGDLDFS